MKREETLRKVKTGEYSSKHLIERVLSDTTCRFKHVFKIFNASEPVIANGEKQSVVSTDWIAAKPTVSRDDRILSLRGAARRSNPEKAAFTLAEVLITIGIIGVVAALTIPFLIQRTNSKELVSSFLKSHAVLSNAFKEMEVVEGIKVTDMNMDSESDNYFPTLFESHLRKTLDCEEGKICLTDGSVYEYQNTNFTTTCTEADPCAELLLDVNGKKGPNKPGKDQYTLLVTKDGIKAKGSDTECSGLDCGKYVLSHHKLWTGEVETTTNNNEVANNPETPSVEPAEPAVTCSEVTRDCDGVYNVCSDGTETKISTINCPTGCADSNCNSCIASTHKKEGNSCVEMSATEKKAYETMMAIDECDASNATNCVIDDLTLNKINNQWLSLEISDSTTGYLQSEYYSKDKWSGAVSYCESKGLRLPSVSELQQIQTFCGETGAPACDGFFWSSELVESDNRAPYTVLFQDGSAGSYIYRNYSNIMTVCIP